MQNKLRLHAVATDKPSILHKIGDIWKIEKSPIIQYGESRPHYLYLTSDEEIKGSNWVLNTLTKSVLRCSNDEDVTVMNRPKNHYRKIVATTNPDLWYNFFGFSGGGNPTPTGIGKIPQSLIEYFVERQGKVDSVMVEYWSDIDKGGHPTGVTLSYVNTPKLNQSGEIIWNSVIEVSSNELYKALKSVLEGCISNDGTIVKPPAEIILKASIVFRNYKPES